MIDLDDVLKDITSDVDSSELTDFSYGVAWLQMNGIDPDQMVSFTISLTAACTNLELGAAMFRLGWEARGHREREEWGL